jgi:hypothetical protein
MTMSRNHGVVNTNCAQPAVQSACCPDCGALECLCRPRFFAGQLLSEQDLNRLDSYIRNKHRLHNLNLHGWGVVNGLLVLCDPCGEVKVTQGYAVDPCGGDIVVCETTGVAICDLIRQCKQNERPVNCSPFQKPPNSRCDDVEEEWILTIQYQEWPSRGVTALRGNHCSIAKAQTACSCGSSTVDGCRCASTGNKTASASQGAASACNQTKTNRGASAECEPTVICEGYRFGVYRKPVKDDPKADDDDVLVSLSGSFWDAFKCCVEPLMASIPPTPDFNKNDNVQQLAAQYVRWCCQFRDNLINYFLTHNNTSCEIIDFLRAIVCPNINNPDNFQQDLLRSILQLLVAWAEGVKNCFCLALLPPVPQATCDTRVPLASVRIRTRDCKVLSICNWTTERKMMLTWPALVHWLSIVPVGEFLRELIDALCCRSLLHIFDRFLRLPDSVDVSHSELTAAFSNAEATNKTPTFAQSLHFASVELSTQLSPDFSVKINAFSRLTEKVAARGKQPLELGAILNSVSPRFKLPANGHDLDSIEAKNLPVLLLSELVAKPVLGNFIGLKAAAAKIAEFQAELGKPKTAGAESTAAGSRNTEEKLAALEAQLKEQFAQIAALRSQLGNKP